MSLFNNMVYTPFCKRLRSVRVSRGISEYDIARKLGVTIEEYKGYESGELEMPEFSKIRASKILNCPALLTKIKF